MSAQPADYERDAWGNLVPPDTHYCGGMKGRHCFLAGCPAGRPKESK